MSLEIIVAGAGIPGLYAARELARSGKKVALIDHAKTPGEPNYSTAGTPVETIERFQLPKEGIASLITSFVFATKDHEARKNSENPLSYVLDFRGMKQLMAAQFIALGGEMLWDTKALQYEQAGDHLLLHTSTGDRETQTLVDATGSPGSIAVQAGLRVERPSALSVGVEYIVRSSSLSRFDHTIALYLDTVLCPYGYAWVFDEGNGTYKVGLCEYYVDPNRELPPLNTRLESFLRHVTNNQPSDILEKHGGSKFMTTNFGRVHSGNVYGIGDAIGAINPLYGEGIRHGLVSAQLAVAAILANNGELYEQTWSQYIGKKWKQTEFKAHVLYNKADSDTQHLYNTLVNQTEKYGTAQSILDAGYEYQSQSFLAHPFRTLELNLAAIRALL